MNTKFYKTLLPTIIFLFLCHSNLFPSIISGTLISTPDSLVSIESLQIGDTIVGYDLNNGIMHTKIAMVTKKENLYTSEKQKF